MTRSLLALSLVTCAALAGVDAQSQPAGSPPRDWPPQGRTNTVFVTAMEENGAPVVDLVASDFTIKENGKDRDVLKVELARVPMQIAIIVDDNGTGIFRSGLVSFVQLLQGRAEMSLDSVVGQTQRLVDYTANAEKVVEAIVQLTARPGTPDGGQLLEGIFQAAKDQEKREAQRPVIVAVTVGGEEHSTLPAHHVLDQIAKSGSTLYVISVANCLLRQTRQIDKPAALARREPESQRSARRRAKAERRLRGKSSSPRRGSPWGSSGSRRS